jgi:hypothetical protein
MEHGALHEPERRAPSRRVGCDFLPTGRGGARRSHRLVHGPKVRSSAVLVPREPRGGVSVERARPHPGPLPRGEGDLVPASWPGGGAGLARRSWAAGRSKWNAGLPMDRAPSRRAARKNERGTVPFQPLRARPSAATGDRSRPTFDEPRSCHGEEAPSQIHEAKLEPPHVGFYRSGVQCVGIQTVATGTSAEAA